MNLLVVTDHLAHRDSNSMYSLSRALREDDRSGKVWACSRGVELNKDFFSGTPGASIYAVEVNHAFAFDARGSVFIQKPQWIDRLEIGAILIRMPQPFDPAFLFSLESIVPPDKIVNRPEGIVETATKEFLLKVSYLCPDVFLCLTLDQAMQHASDQEIVLKPFHSYGGHGILRIGNGFGWIGQDRFPLADFVNRLPPDQFPMLAMRFLPNVTQGDKRTIVVHREVLGSALRLPAPGHWICNAAQDGQAFLDQMDEEERIIEDTLTPLLHRKGIIMYGFDTLVDDDGRRVLSEINTLSIGGLQPLQDLSGRPIMQQAARLIWDYLTHKD